MSFLPVGEVVARHFSPSSYRRRPFFWVPFFISQVAVTWENYPKKKKKTKRLHLVPDHEVLDGLIARLNCGVACSTVWWIATSSSSKAVVDENDVVILGQVDLGGEDLALPLVTMRPPTKTPLLISSI